MNQSIVISVIGPDRTGLVDTLSRIISSHGGNWEGSRLAHLSGQFSGMVHALVPAEQVEQLESALQAIEGLTVQLAKGSNEVVALQTVNFDVVGSDRPGIVQQVASVLAAQGANVEELVTDVQSAPMSGEPMFHAEVRVGLPDGLDADQLGDALESLSDDIMVTISE